MNINQNKKLCKETNLFYFFLESRLLFQIKYVLLFVNKNQKSQIKMNDLVKFVRKRANLAEEISSETEELPNYSHLETNVSTSHFSKLCLNEIVNRQIEPSTEENTSNQFILKMKNQHMARIFY